MIGLDVSRYAMTPILSLNESLHQTRYETGRRAPCRPVVAGSEEAEDQAQRFIDLDKLVRVEKSSEVTEPALGPHCAGLLDQHTGRDRVDDDRRPEERDDRRYGNRVDKDS